MELRVTIKMYCHLSLPVIIQILNIVIFQVKKYAEELLLLLCKGKLQFTEAGWLYFLDSLTPVLPLLQCLVNLSTPLGNSIFQMLDPDVSLDIKLPFSQVIFR